jgi:hypothetical protein
MQAGAFRENTYLLLTSVCAAGGPGQSPPSLIPKCSSCASACSPACVRGSKGADLPRLNRGGTRPVTGHRTLSRLHVQQLYVRAPACGAGQHQSADLPLTSFCAAGTRPVTLATEPSPDFMSSSCECVGLRVCQAARARTTCGPFHSPASALQGD